MDIHNDGPYVFYKRDNHFSINYLKGNKADGFYVQQKEVSIDSLHQLTCYSPLDSTSFDFFLNKEITSPKLVYYDTNPILAISDIEGNYLRLRDFLIASKVIDKELKWTFGKGHMVLIGDFVDRGFFVTQVLWFIYKLEQEAKKHGGLVHYIIGNHELKMMQGDYRVTASKYYQVASILERHQTALYDTASFIGRWLSSKNAIECINGNLFVHGGLHPALGNADLTIAKINQLIRDNYYKPFYNSSNKGFEELVLSTETGPCWYRGFFSADLEQHEIDNLLKKFASQKVIVGHTIQQKVNWIYEKKVIAIDVQHPQDQYEYWPRRKSEALFIKGDKYYRVLNDGKTEEL